MAESYFVVEWGAGIRRWVPLEDRDEGVVTYATQGEAQRDVEERMAFAAKNKWAIPPLTWAFVSIPDPPNDCTGSPSLTKAENA